MFAFNGTEIVQRTAKWGEKLERLGWDVDMLEYRKWILSNRSCMIKLWNEWQQNLSLRNHIILMLMEAYFTVKVIISFWRSSDRLGLLVFPYLFTLGSQVQASPVRTNQSYSVFRARYKKWVGHYCVHFVEAQGQAEEWKMSGRAGGEHGGRRSLKAEWLGLGISCDGSGICIWHFPSAGIYLSVSPTKDISY